MSLKIQRNVTTSTRLLPPLPVGVPLPLGLGFTTRQTFTPPTCAILTETKWRPSVVGLGRNRRRRYFENRGEITPTMDDPTKAKTRSGGEGTARHPLPHPVTARSCDQYLLCQIPKPAIDPEVFPNRSDPSRA
jgi:hypothetical protein